MKRMHTQLQLFTWFFLGDSLSVDWLREETEPIASCCRSSCCVGDNQRDARVTQKVDCLIFGCWMEEIREEKIAF